MNEPIISVSGLRGVVGKSLTPEVAARYAAAFAAELPPGPVVLARDGRASGPVLTDAVSAALGAAGREVLLAGIAATPTVGVLVRHHRAAGGIQISASHNPPEWNGLKLFSSAGQILTAAGGERVLARYRQAPPFPAESPRNIVAIDDPHAGHLALVRGTVDPARIRGRGFRAVLDANHGAGSLLGVQLLEDLGCRVTLLGEPPDGRFEHPPEPTAENLAGVARFVASAGADIGFCQDPDADRLAVIDASGRYLGEESTLAICLDHVLSYRPGPVVTNCATSRMAADLAARYGVPFHRTAVGEANVVEKMQVSMAVFGGEGNGGPIDPRVGYVRDSFVGMALILDAMARRGATVAELADALPRYAMRKTKVALAAERVGPALAALERRFADARPDRLDGLRLDWPGRWLLVRASNTEPIVRIIVEAPSDEDADRLARDAAEVLAIFGT